MLNIIGWGTLLPTGAIIARYFRKVPMECSEWFSLHILCQATGYLLGSLGWAIGIWLGNSSVNYTFHSHRVLGIIIFIFSTLQVMVKSLSRRPYHLHHELATYFILISLLLLPLTLGADVFYRSAAEERAQVSQVLGNMPSSSGVCADGADNDQHFCRDQPSKLSCKMDMVLRGSGCGYGFGFHHFGNLQMD